MPERRIDTSVRNYAQWVEAGGLARAATLFITGRRLDAVERILQRQFPNLRPQSIGKIIRVGRESAKAARREAGGTTSAGPDAELAEPTTTYRYGTVVEADVGHGAIPIEVVSSTELTLEELRAQAVAAAELALEEILQESPGKSRTASPGVGAGFWVTGVFQE